MTTARAEPTRPRDDSLDLPTGLRLDRPVVADGGSLWRLARDSKTLDVNSSYSYLLWCRDFADTSAVARDGAGKPVGFISGHLRPESPRTLLIWQITVAESLRGLGVAGALLDTLTDRVAAEHGLDWLETSIAPGNSASQRLFATYAERHGSAIAREALFEPDQFPDGAHDPEILHRIGPLSL
ncbi:diaminobutyrate acetyltransferase [Streptomyces sp. TN58]|uniref:diaminobutyrate acetyltransferase n=1 Tax=Streptomyces sp. TN58 TaxID=234612 RepID=UPI0009505FFB|nr:diaminobutyrate acetyltransferase [Streptomyces sp. TN58]APU43390.1 diaminobutyrate acetyltransferase [Streptomyces sp. TN58]